MLRKESGKLEIVKYLLQNSALTGLNNASENGHIGIVEYLIANGVDLNAKDRFNKTAFNI